MPQRIEVTLVEPAEAPAEEAAPDWSGAIAQLRSVAQWIIGGVVATAAGVFAGGSLSKLGTMSLASNADRLGLALSGVAMGFLAIAAIMYFGLAVIAPGGHSLPELAKATKPSVDFEARRLMYRLEAIEEKTHPLDALLAQPDKQAAKVYVPRFYRIAPFCAVSARFRRLNLCMIVCVPIAIIGFGLFAWAANPPDPPPKTERGMTIKITL